MGEMINFLTRAPLLIALAFGICFAVSFLIVKLSHSTMLNDRFERGESVRRLEHMSVLRQKLERDRRNFLAGRDPKTLSPQERKLYNQILKSYNEEFERLYGGSNGKSGW